MKACSVAYLHQSRALMLVFDHGVALEVPESLVPGLMGMDPTERKNVVVVNGDALHWAGADCLVSVSRLVHALFGPLVLAERQRLLGSRSSPAKAAAARANGSRPKRRRKAK